MRAHVDVLTMTATPIPRTLEMALTGIRQMSTIDTPPEDRQPVLHVRRRRSTTTSRSAPSAASCCARARSSGSTTASRRSTGRRRGCSELLPDARIVVAHGQMDEEQLERRMVRFWERDADVLVCTTIIESGLDVPNANTLIVDRADMLGLAQLYQLRGRVGRSAERAFAYFFFPAHREMTEEAHLRLATIAKHQALGSRVPDRAARPRDPRRRQHARRRAERPHRRGGVRRVRAHPRRSRCTSSRARRSSRSRSSGSTCR